MNLLRPNAQIVVRHQGGRAIRVFCRDKQESMKPRHPVSALAGHLPLDSSTSESEVSVQNSGHSN